MLEGIDARVSDWSGDDPTAHTHNALRFVVLGVKLGKLAAVAAVDGRRHHRILIRGAPLEAA